MTEVNNFVAYMPIIAGAWSVGFAMMVTTNNILSALIFKLIPFTLGMGSLYSGLTILGVI